MIERAYKKLALDALVIQQGRLAEQKSEPFLHYKLALHYDMLIHRTRTTNILCFCGLLQL